MLPKRQLRPDGIVRWAQELGVRFEELVRRFLRSGQQSFKRFDNFRMMLASLSAAIQVMQVSLSGIAQRDCGQQILLGPAWRVLWLPILFIKSGIHVDRLPSDRQRRNSMGDEMFQGRRYRFRWRVCR